MLFHKKTIRDIDLKDKTILLRVDYNVPLRDGHVADDYRIRMSLPTLNALLEQRAKVIMIAHLGRPEGRVVPELSLRPVSEVLSDLLGQAVDFVEDCVGNEVTKRVKQLQGGHVLLLENLRFHPEEEQNDSDFARQLADLADNFVQDGFGVVHRAGASTEGVTHFLPSVAGLLVENEVRELTKAILRPKKPLVAVVGGVKIETKMELLENFIAKAQRLIIGGAMANTFLKAKEVNIGRSLVDKDELDTARNIFNKCTDSGVDLILPFRDVAVAKSADSDQPRRIVDTDSLDDDDIILDIGPKSVSSIKENLKDAQTIIWNGPLGMMELDNFREGTRQVANAIIDSGAMTVVGGGETAEFVRQENMLDKFSHVSTGGGASLELLAGKPLPGVDSLLDK